MAASSVPTTPVLSVNECPAKFIHGPIDIDSIFLLAVNLLAFQPAGCNKIFINEKKY